MAATDPSQFAPLPLQSQANAVSRRLGSPSYNPMSSPGNTPTPAADGPLMNVSTDRGTGSGQMTVRDPIDVRPRMLDLFSDTGGGRPPKPPYIGAESGSYTPDPNNPLGGGTGDYALDNQLAGDTTYQGQISDLLRNLDQYNGQRNLGMSQKQADYDAQQRSLGDQTVKDQLAMRNQAAANGILQSGIYANQLGQYNTANQQQMTNLLGGMQNYKDTSQLGYNQFLANEIAAKNQALQEAVARRAAQIGQF